jgi:hypothetical protein
VLSAGHRFVHGTAHTQCVQLTFETARQVLAQNALNQNLELTENDTRQGGYRNTQYTTDRRVLRFHEEG